MTQAKNGDTIRIHYTGTLRDGEQFDSSEGREPLEFVLGTGQIIRGLEAGVLGMAKGDTKTVDIAAADAYGDHDPQKTQKVKREMIPAEIELQVGLQLGARTDSGEQVMFTVIQLTDEEVTMDGNHPLAGKDLIFDIEIVDVITAE